MNIKNFRINIPVRVRNPFFWVGIGAVALNAIGLDPAVLTSWGAVGNAIHDTVSNPFQLGTLLLAVMAVVNDPTTKGVSDSERAMTYQNPAE